MNKYTIYCTEEQTKKAIELGAPLQYNYQDKEIVYIENEGYMKIPTAEQMIGWLRTKNIAVDIHTYFRCDNNNTSISHYQFTVTDCVKVFTGDGMVCESFQKATLAAINVALNYLSESKKSMEE